MVKFVVTKSEFCRNMLGPKNNVNFKLLEFKVGRCWKHFEFLDILRETPGKSNIFFSPTNTWICYTCSIIIIGIMICARWLSYVFIFHFRYAFLDALPHLRFGSWKWWDVCFRPSKHDFHNEIALKLLLMLRDIETTGQLLTSLLY